ncbi:hypothetical protein [Kutzneria buriramensis]|uniref:hypothetical protein n=1 Tax=Kutzneria buriramensis TaxID=1045776 RepID=UPI001476E1A1|nr:hypothetical protein [Kutzneria buriramensis]
MTTRARLLTLFAVLVGIFLMHGLPMQSCAGDSMAAPMAHVAAGVSSSHGGVCEFTAPSRDTGPLLTLVLVAVALLVTVLWRPLLVGGPSRRGPPLSGARLLTVVCVSRT